MLAVAGMLFLSACGAKGAEGTGVEAKDFWTRAALKDGNGAAYMILQNHTSEDVALIGASSDAAMAVEIHLSAVDAAGTMQMTKQESVTVPANGELELKPGSYHVMMMGLKQDLKAGDKISLTLHFKNYEDITLTVPVQDAANMGGSGMDGQMP